MQHTNENKGRQLTWADIPQEDISRFRLERAGRSYAANYACDPIIDVYRSIYNAYCKGHEWDYFYAPDGTENVETGVFESDLDAAIKEIERRRDEENARYAQKKIRPPVLSPVVTVTSTATPTSTSTSTFSSISTDTFKFSFASLG